MEVLNMITKIFEWIGFIIVGVSIYANAIIRADGITSGAGINLSIIGMITGVILTLTFFLVRKLKVTQNI